MNDEQQIRDTIKLYFDSMYESNPDKVVAAFHPNAKITGYLEDGVHQMSVSPPNGRFQAADSTDRCNT